MIPLYVFAYHVNYGSVVSFSISIHFSFIANVILNNLNSRCTVKQYQLCIIEIIDCGADVIKMNAVCNYLYKKNIFVATILQCIITITLVTGRPRNQFLKSNLLIVSMKLYYVLNADGW